LRKETLPEALKTEGIAFNEIEVYQTTRLLKYQIRKNLME
jgi:uroporphyrinogen-III synthase